jgi:signal transduction histidine kinase/CheY-like chemotaxis protein
MQSDLARQLYIESIKTMYVQNTGASNLAFPGTGLLLFYTWCETEEPAPVLIAWLMILTIISIAGFIMLKQVSLDSEIDYEKAKKLDLNLNIINIILSLVWAFFFTYTELVNERFSYIILLYLGASTIFCALVLSLSMRLFLSFISMQLLAGLFMFLGSDYWIEYLLMMFLCLMYSVNIIRTGKKNFEVTFNLRHENNILLADIKEKKEIAEQANTAKTTFFAAASHDLRQPLQSITLLLAALTRYISDQKQSEILSKARESVCSLGQLLDSLLDISKLDSGLIEIQPVLFSLSDYLNGEIDRYSTLTEDKGLTLHGHISENLNIISDPILVRRVVSNLLDNALNYTNSGGIILSAEQSKTGVIITIKDSGVGISDLEQQLIFQEFYQVDNPERNRRKGLGLGLAIVKRLLYLLGGNITLKSKEELGSCFQIILPNLDGQLHERQEKRVIEESTSDFSNLHILIIEDDVDVRISMELLLQSYDCIITSAATEQEAISKLKGHDSPPLSAIIVDYRLRDNKTGLECADSIMSYKGIIIPVLVITGETAPAVISILGKVGHQFFHKPISPEKLMGFLEKLNTN